MIMPKKYSNKYIINTGSGLQDVDGLSNSPYFINQSQRYIKGEISLEEFDRIINSYYKTKPNTKKRSDEADKVSIRIAKLISDDSFTFTVGQLLTIHKYLFKGIIKNSGKLRTYNFTKSEWILDGASVTYGDYKSLKDTLQYDFELEKEYDYKDLSIDETIDHLAIFISNLWQIHVFEEGNTRTTAVFVIKYLRSLGFDVTNDTFAKNAWYFRNALVRANYTNISKGITEDRSYLILFLRNLLLNEKNELKNKRLHINLSYDTKERNKETQIIKLIEKNPKMTTEELSKKLEVSVRTIKNILSRLKKEKIISRENGKRFGYWKVCLNERTKKY